MRHRCRGRGLGLAPSQPARAATASVRVDVPGGTVCVTEHADGELDLRGPAVIVARGTIDAQLVEGARVTGIALQRESTAVAAKGPIGSLGRRLDDLRRRGAGHRRRRARAAGSCTSSARHGVLGDVDPDVVLAAAYVFPADHLRREWETARQVMTPR